MAQARRKKLLYGFGTGRVKAAVDQVRGLVPEIRVQPLVPGAAMVNNDLRLVSRADA